MIPLAPIGRITVLFITTFGSAALVFLTQVILVRLLSISDYGQLVALLAVINLMTPLSTYGIGWFWLRAFGEEGWRGFRWIGPSIRLLAFTCTVATLLLVAYVWFRFDPGNRLFVSVLAVPILLGQVFAEATSARLQLEENFIMLAVWQSLTQTGRFLVAGGLMAMNLYEDGILPVAGYAALGAMLTAAGLVSLGQMSRRRIALGGHGLPSDTAYDNIVVPSIIRLIREATPFCLWTIFYLIYFQSVVVLLAVIVGKPAAAIYNVAFQIISAAHLVPNVIYSKYLFGKIFRWSEHNVDKFLAAFHLGVLGMTMLGFVSMVVAIVAGPILVPILFGPAYSAASPIIIALSITILTRFMQTAYASLFCSKENMVWQVSYGGTAALFCVVVNIILLPRYGLTGAVVSQVSTELLLLALYMRGAKRVNKGMHLWQSFRIVTFRHAIHTLVAAPAE